MEKLYRIKKLNKLKWTKTTHEASIWGGYLFYRVTPTYWELRSGEENDPLNDDNFIYGDRCSSIEEGKRLAEADYENRLKEMLEEVEG